MKKVTLPNGMKVIYQPKKGNSVVIQIMVKVGSNYEKINERGLSHFLEHMLFEGTKKRPTNREISNEIEKIGGEFNAYTTNERTCFYVKVLKKHFNKAVDILADILQNPLFKEEHVKKEKNIVIKEIDLVHDEPSYYQWVLLQKNLFVKHPTKNPVYGDKKVIRGLNRKKVVSFFQKYYAPNNLTVSVVGNVSGWKKEIKKKFISRKGRTRKLSRIKEPLAKKSRIKKEKKKIINAYSVLAFKTVPQNHRDSYVLEVINGILGRGQSGRMFTEIRGKRGLAYDVGTQNINEIDFGYFAIYATVDKKNIALVRKLILEELKKLKQIKAEDLNESKNYIEGNYLLEMEENQKVADRLLFWEQVKDAKLMKDFLKEVKKVSISDVQRVVEKYFKNYTQVVLEGR